MQRFYKKEGAVTQRSSNFDWVATDSEGGSSLALTVINRGGRWRIRVESSQWMSFIFTLVFGGMLALVISLPSYKHGYHWAAFVVCTGIALGMLTVFRSLRSSHVQSVSLLMDRLTSKVDTELHVESRPNHSTAVDNSQFEVRGPEVSA